MEGASPATYEVYKDISARTNGEIYIGVVGPVRTGKSTFIKRFMELFVIPQMEDDSDREQTRDELPQSAGGKMIMTTEPKFIPKEAAVIQTEDGTKAKVRLIDCVGYMVDGATGHEENEVERMVKTPWFDGEIPFTQAAEIGTRKVIHDHSTIGIVMMGDGSFGELTPQQFMPALEKTVTELKQIGKPFVVILNCQKPYAPESAELAGKIAQEFEVQVVPVNCEQLRKEDVSKILSTVLSEFPVTALEFHIPKWMELLPSSHTLKQNMIGVAKDILQKVTWMKDFRNIQTGEMMPEITQLRIAEMNAANGSISLDIQLKPECYYKTVSEYSGMEISSELQLLRTLFELASRRGEYEKVQAAMTQVRERGYGVVTPERFDIHLDEPVLIKQSGKFGVKMKAMAPSIHMIRANIETEIAPIVGSEEQAQDLIVYIRNAAKEGEDAVWETNIFGKTIQQIVEDGMFTKINQMTDDCQLKLQDAMAKIINDSNGGMVCIII